MIDNFALLVSHGLLLVMCIRVFQRPDLDSEGDEKDNKKGVRRLRRSTMRGA
jgi:hypothetical protein